MGGGGGDESVVSRGREEDSVSKPRDKVMIMTREKKEIEFIDHNPHKSIVWGKKKQKA